MLYSRSIQEGERLSTKFFCHQILDQLKYMPLPYNQVINAVYQYFMMLREFYHWGEGKFSGKIWWIDSTVLQKEME